MTLRVLYFAWVRERIGFGEESLALEEPLPLSQLLDRLRSLSDGHAAALAKPERLRAAINQQFVGWNAIAMPGDEVAFFPPVTGG